ncbi:MAG: IS5 family transposase [Alphaproteobacteria bacterium]|nr:IS5 family transposase [Alphaproteobacteria bacterium]
MLRTGCPWRDLPERYGSYTTCYNRYNRWTKRGVWKNIFDQLAKKSKHSLHLIDSTIVRAHRSASGAKGGNWSNGQGRPLEMVLAGGQAHDAPVLPELLGHKKPPLAICADKAYDSRAIRQAIMDDGALSVSRAEPQQRTNPLRSKALSRKKYRGTLLLPPKDMRYIAQRFDKHADNFLSAVYLFSIRLWLNY